LGDLTGGVNMTDSFFEKDDRESGKSQIPNLDDSFEEKNGQASFDKDRGLIAALLSYVPLLCLIPLLQMRDNEQARFHSRQGFLLFLIELLAVLLLIPGLSAMIWKTVLIIALGASVAGIIFGIQGKKYKLPIIGDIAEKMKI
jgi:fumarate reductase subunit D